ncbi:hypothetical protein [Mesorhizobium sp. WSM3224]|uniref:hypothetical protein n=1 Tax=Mesorhizobium sp. WSM3224 TaxID=1040986 RepID=UPI0012EB7972|nr:hypothetical protein [Mesorhizobium sp. WSM3224]
MLAAVLLMMSSAERWADDATGIGVYRMIENGAADPAQVALLAKAVIEFCTSHQIVRIDHREQVAGKVMSLFGRGVTDPDQILIALEKDSSMSRLRRLTKRLSQSGSRRKI